MKQISATDEAITFELERRELDALVHVLRLFPVVPADHHAPSQDAEQQRIIHEALAEQRAANKREVTAWLTTPKRFEQHETNFRFTLNHSDIEWFLQVVNDVRVGNWLLLGSPELQKIKPAELNEQQMPHWFAMELSGYFQMSLLEALEK